MPNSQKHGKTLYCPKTITMESKMLMPWHSVKENVYHNHADCESRETIPADDRRHGTGNKPLCKVCEKLSKSKKN